MERKLRCKKRCNRYSILGCNTEKGQNIVRVMNGNFKNDLHEVSLRKFKRLKSNICRCQWDAIHQDDGIIVYQNIKGEN